MPAAWTQEMIEPGIAARDAEYGGVACFVSEPEEPVGTLLYFHGGGYRMGSPAAWANFASRLSAAAGLRVIVPDYRLAPEHPFPAAVEDALAAYVAVDETFGGPLLAGGDSAGGGLAASLALAAQQKPDGLILISPWLDLAVSDPAYDNRPADQYFPKASAQEAAELYLQGYPASDPLASPLLGEFAGFPPTLMFASADECVVGDVLRLQAKLADARVFAEARVVPGMTHVWPVIAPALPESAAALAAIATFTQRRISNS
jgi:acetyl esterase/lipase